MGRSLEPPQLPDRERGGPDRSAAKNTSAKKVTVLLVEDEGLICEVARAALEEGGYLVRAASNGHAAISILEGPGGAPSVLVTDVRLGYGPTGWDIARRAREISPEIAIVYITGGEAHRHAGLGVPNSAMVDKPFGTDQVLAAVAALLAARPPA